MNLISVGALNLTPLQDVSNSRVERRAQIVSLQSSGIEKAVIAKFTGCSPSTVSRWAIRGKDYDLNDKVRSGRPAIFSDNLQLRLIGFYCQTPPLPDCGRWTLRWAEKHLREHPEVLGTFISRSGIHAILKKHQLKPHLTKYFLQITDPDFFPKMEHLLELFATPPEYLFFFDECPGIQILTRTAPDMTTEEKKRWLVEFEYNRNGTIDVLAFLEHKTGKVFAKCTYDHKSDTFASVFESHVKSLPLNVRLDYVMDNLSTHCNDAFTELVARLCDVECPKLKTADERRKWLGSEDKRIVIHFTPFHGSWLNLVENWFGILNQKCLKESFDSADSMIAALYNFFDTWNVLLAHPFNWKYKGTGLHEKAIRRFINVIDYERKPLPVKFLTKQLLLMQNLITSYWGKVPVKLWEELNEVIRSKQPYIKNIIENDDKPKRKEKAFEAFNQLLETMVKHLDPEGKMASVNR